MRPAAVDYIKNIFDIFVELKGDRLYREDGAIIGGIAILDGQPVTVIADYRGKDIDELLARNFGMPMPEGYPDFLLFVITKNCIICRIRLR